MKKKQIIGKLSLKTKDLSALNEENQSAIKGGVCTNQTSGCITATCSAVTACALTCVGQATCAKGC